MAKRDTARPHHSISRSQTSSNREQQHADGTTEQGAAHAVARINAASQDRHQAEDEQASSSTPRTGIRRGLVSPTDVLRLQRTMGNQVVSRLVGQTAKQMRQSEKSTFDRFATSNTGNVNTTAIQAKFAQNINTVQDSYHGGVHSQYDTPNNIVEIHIDAGANQDGKMMMHFLEALWEARDTIAAGQNRQVGHLFMRPGGAQVLKLTMEMLGEALGAPGMRTAARNAQKARKLANTPMAGDNDRLDSTIVPEHLAYRDSMIGVNGITMAPSGGGTSGGTEDMLANTPNAAAERLLFDQAVLGLRPFMSLHTRIELASINAVISMLESKVDFFKLLSLKAKYALGK